MSNRKKIIDLLSSPDPDSIELGWELAANFAKDLLELRQIGDEVFGFTVIDLEFNNLSALPGSIGKLQNLKIFYLSENQLAVLPDSIGQLKNLKKLCLSGNQLTALPESIGQLQKLERLHLSYNKLTALPDSIGQLKKLERLYLKRNPISESELDRINKLLPNCNIFF